MNSEQDVLIHASRSDVEHKHIDNLDDGEEAYWSVSGTPQRTVPGRYVWFADDDGVHAFGRITAVDNGKLWFDGVEFIAPFEDVDIDAEPPTRGFTYIDPALPQCEEDGCDASAMYEAHLHANYLKDGDDLVYLCEDHKSKTFMAMHNHVMHADRRRVLAVTRNRTLDAAAAGGDVV